MYRDKVLVNRYPFWLMWNYTTEANIDYEKNIIKTERRESHFERASKLEIFLLKYLPFILLFVFMARLPMDSKEWIVMGITSFFMLIGIYIKTHSTRFFKLYVFLLFLAMYVLFLNIDGIGRYLNLAIGDFITLYIIFFLIYDYKINGLSDYYYLTDIKNAGKVRISKRVHRKALRVPFTQKHLINNIPTGVNAHFNYSFGGYYFKPLKQDLQNV